MSDSIQLNWSTAEQLIPLCVDFYKQHDAGENIDLMDAANKVGQVFGISDVKQYAFDQVESGLQDGFRMAFGNDDSAAMAAAFASCCKPAMSLVLEFAKGERDSASLIANLNKICLDNTGQIGSVLQQALGVPESAANAIADKMGPYAVSLFCFAAAYKIYAAAARDAGLAHERRLEVERLTAESIAQMKACRAQAETVLSKCLLGYLEPVHASMAGMDTAILENDNDGFIAANVELWNIFGREAQYRSAAEFDDLMLSDETFKL